jgi:septation ring formation regulator EzrA
MENGDQPATKADLQDATERLRSEFRRAVEESAAQLHTEIQESAAELHTEIQESAAQLRSEFQHGFDDLKETFRDGQTELLKALYNFGTSIQQRMKQLEGDEAAIMSRLSTLEERVIQLERKANFPNQPNP